MLKPYYQNMIGDFDDVIDMCNQLGVNLDDVYDYSDLGEEDDSINERDKDSGKDADDDYWNDYL